MTTEMENKACVVCGHIPDEPVVLSEQDKQEYLRSVLGGKCFTKEYKLHEGNIRLLFSVQSQKDIRYLNYALGARPRGSSLMNDQSDRMMVKCVFYLSEFNDTSYEVPGHPAKEDLGTPEEELERLLEMFYTRFGDIPEGLCSCLIEAMIKFFTLSMALSSNGLDETFYKGAGLI